MNQPVQASVRYDAFLSYSHRSDGTFGPRFQQRLEAFARRRRSARALRVFRDDANLAANPDLWDGIQEALAASKWLMLLASPDAAASPWVGKEIQWWLENRSPERILIGVTDGDLVWDDTANDFDVTSSAAHPAIRGVLRAEPRWIDLRGVRSLSRLDDHDARVQDAVAEFAAPLHGVEKDDLIGEHHRRQRRDRRRVQIALAVFVTLFLVAATAGVFAVIQARQATQAQDSVIARYLAAEAEDLRDRQPGLAKQLSLLSYRIDHAAGHSAVLNSQRTPGVINGDEPANDLASSADGHLLAISTADAIVLRTRGGADTGRVSTRPAGPIAVSRDGRLLAAATQDDTAHISATTLRLWDITNPGNPKQAAATRVSVAIGALAVSADGHVLFAGASTGEVLSWDISDPAAPKPLPPLRAHSAMIDSLAISPRRNLMASTSADGRVQLWDTTTATRPAPITILDEAEYQTSWPSPKPLHRVAFDQTGELLATVGKTADSSDSSTIPHLWALGDPHTPRRIPFEHQDADLVFNPWGQCPWAITALAFSPEKNFLAVVCDGNWYLWLYGTEPDARSFRLGVTTHGLSRDSGGAVVFDPGDARLLLQATKRGIQVWDVANPFTAGSAGGAFLRESTTESGLGNSLALQWSGQRRQLALIQEGQNLLWDLTDPEHANVLSTTPAPDWWPGAAIALSPGGILAAAEMSDKQHWGLRLRDTANPNGQPLATIDTLVNGVAALAFSPTKPILAVSDYDRMSRTTQAPPTIRVYNIANLRHPQQIAQLKATSDHLAFSPDGQTLVATDLLPNEQEDVQTSIRLRLRSWDLMSPAHPTELWTRSLPPSEQFARFAFRPDGALLAVFEGTGTLRIWPVDRHHLLGDPIVARVGGTAGSNVAFSPEGTRLALIAGPENGAIGTQRTEIWDLANPAAPTRQSYLPVHSEDLFAPGSLAFSPDGGTLVVAREVGVDLLDTDPQRVATRLCAAAGDPITSQQWERYLPGKPYHPPCQ